MSTRGLHAKTRGKHARVEQKKETFRSKRLAGATCALALSMGMAGSMQGVTAAFAAVPADDGNAENEASQSTQSSDLSLAASSVSACLNALTRDLGQGTSLMDAAHYDSEVARAQRIEAVIDEAFSYLGVRYRYGGTTPAGFDCSGFTGYVFRNTVGMELPRTAGAQSGIGEVVSLADAQRGDLLFWGSRHGGVYHTGIYLGDGEYIHAASSGKVKIASFGSFRPTFATRVL